MTTIFFQPKFDDKGRMRAINLTRPVKIEGKDFFGRNAWLWFVPAYDYNPGWYWDSGKHCGRFWGIYPENIVTKKRRLCLMESSANGGKVLINCLEHITALRMLGLDAVGISCGPSTWPPYLMAGELWEWLTPHLRYGDYSLEWKEASLLPGVGHCGDDFTRLTSAYGYGSHGNISSGVSIDVFIDFVKHGGPVARGEFFLGPGVDMEELERVFYSATPGWPPKLYYLSKLAGWFGWPHNKRICWGGKCPIQNDPGEVWIRHRIVDIFGSVGAMSIALGEKTIISTKIDSFEGGHESDLSALKKSFKRR